MTRKIIMRIQLGVLVVLALGFVSAVPVDLMEPAITLDGINELDRAINENSGNVREDALDGNTPEDIGLETRYITFENTTDVEITPADNQAVVARAKKWLSSRIYNGEHVPNRDMFANVGVIVAIDSLDNVIGIVCTGSIVDEDIVLSAAHCVDEIPANIRLVVCAGTIDYFADHGVCNMVTNAAIPRAYHRSTVISGNDLSLLKLSGPMTGIPIMKISLETPPAGLPSMAVGFGLSYPGADRADGRMRYGDTVVVPSDQCRFLELVGQAGDPDLICSNGNHDGSRGTACFGDSGGPLLVPGSTPSEHIAIGVASYIAVDERTGSCRPEYENAYASLSSRPHTKFMLSNVKKLGGSLSLAELSDDLVATVPNDGCFPEGALVVMEDGSSKRMDQVRAGDRVMVSSGRFSDVFGFGHKDGSITSEFVRIETTSEHVIELTAGHYMVIEGTLLAAKDVTSGDILTLYDGSTSKVANISLVNRRGLYNPHTLEGTIIVNDVLASTYTEAVNPKFAHLMLAIPRLAYRLGLKEPLGSMLYASTPAFLRTIARS
ncbi:hypothetical protein NDN08_004234 [Rhodosorus marinus]|uniref:Peptidase S1 domain-containing protein n=1 Tax=Rhodosorus marinus TaxID=101924 RepID=A0AAV8UE30_9RHOD|nr:hypothetical protein NDN08_004234 [Rhodosorus marinus]